MENIRISSLKSSEYGWLPDDIRYPSSRLSIKYTPFNGAKNLFGSVERLSFIDFIRTVPVIAGKGKGGLSDPDRYPYQANLIELLEHPAVRDVTITGGNQSAKTRSIEMWILYRAMYDPTDVLVFYPDQATVRDRFMSSYMPSFKHKNFVELTTGLEDDLTSERCSLLSGMTIKAGWTSSILKMSSRSAGICVVDECDKNPEKVVDSEAAIEFLIEGRGRDYGADFKCVRCTTLSGEKGPGYVARERAEAKFDFLALCPRCGELEYLSPSRVGYAKERGLNGKISQSTALAWYSCSHCASRWNDEMRNDALIHGELRARRPGWKDSENKVTAITHDDRPLKEYLDSEWPGSASFSIQSLVLPTVRLRDWAAAKLAADYDVESKHYFYNHFLDEPFSVGGAHRNPSNLLKRTWGHGFGVMPSGWSAAGLYCGIDSQQDSYYYWVSAIGFSMQKDGTKLRPTMWQVDAGKLSALDENKKHLNITDVLRVLEDRVYVDEVEDTEWPGGVYVKARKVGGGYNIIGGPRKIRMFVIDGRGNNFSRQNITEEAKAWCAAKPSSRRMYWGEGQTSGPLFSAKKDEKAGIWVYHADRDQLEKWVERGLDISPGDPGSILLSKDCEVWMAEHLCNIELNQRSGRFVKPKGIRCDVRDCARMSFLGYMIEQMDRVPQVE